MTYLNKSTVTSKMIHFFVVFHSKLYDECYSAIPEDVLRKYFTFIAVNPSIPKVFTPNKYNIVNEWDLPIYDKTLQEKGYNENSAIWHVFVNKMHKPYSHVGFFQYDMLFKSNLVEEVLDTLRFTDSHTYFALRLETFDFCNRESWWNPHMIKPVIKDYESFFNVKFKYDKLCPLLNTYILPTQNYERVMSWIVQLYDKIYVETMQHRQMQIHKGAIAGYYERIMAFAIAQEDIRSLQLTAVEHDHFYKTSLPKST